MNTTVKRKRGRPRKVTPKVQQKKDKDDEKEGNIICFLALSDDESDNDNFTTRDTENKSSREKISSITESIDEDESSSEESESSFENYNNSAIDIKELIDQIKKRDAIIENLKKNGTMGTNTHTATKHSNIKYHCTTLANADTGKKFKPEPTDAECWWCDYGFETLPVYIPNLYKDEVYYVFGNFCSFNCAAKYNSKMLKDYKCDTRHALLQSLKEKTTKDRTPIKLASERESLKKKGGPDSIEKFRKDFNYLSLDIRMSMPPMIPLVHSIHEGIRD